MRLPSPPLLLITDRRQTRFPLPDVLAAAIDGGCRWISLREKDLPPAERLALLQRLSDLARKRGVVASVHEDLAGAESADLRAIHLPANGDPQEARRRLGNAALVGISTHTLGEVGAAHAAAADYVTLSPIHLTASKPGYGPALGVRALTDAASVGIPVLALGGVTESTASACMTAGAAGVAVMGEIMAAADPAEATARILASMRSAS